MKRFSKSLTNASGFSQRATLRNIKTEPTLMSNLELPWVHKFYNISELKNQRKGSPSATKSRKVKKPKDVTESAELIETKQLKESKESHNVSRNYSSTEDSAQNIKY